jgi:ElaB/YqjD/DUF883 family membrane-anchored ribosome-binding protein
MNTNASTPMHTPTASRQKLVDDIANVASEAGELLKEFSDTKLQRTRQAMTQAQSAISASAGEMGNTAGNYVRAHPWRALGAAGAVGLLAGLLLARR